MCSVMKYQKPYFIQLFVPNLFYFYLISVKYDHKSFTAFYVWRGKLIKWPIKYVILYHCNLWLWLKHTYYSCYFSGVIDQRFHFVFFLSFFFFFIIHLIFVKYRYTYNIIFTIFKVVIRFLWIYSYYLKNNPINIGYT